MEQETFIKKVLLENALKYHGKTNAQAAIGAFMREFPGERENKNKVFALAKSIAEEINSLSEEEQKKLLSNLGGSGAPEKKSRDVFLIEEKNPVLRFEPSPSGPMHIGHSLTLGLNYLLARKNKGKLLLRIADTNPENIYEPAYDLIPADADWYTSGFVKDVVIQSNRMELYYTYAEEMLSKGWAYVCICESEAFRELITKKEACPCREESPAVHIERWELMKTTYEPGDAVVRVKTDVTHKNPALRDWPALRINTSKHPVQGDKYRVWPLMNFSVSVDDIEMNMTHVLRAKDHADNAKRQEYMHNYFGYPIPKTYFIGRINFTDLKLSTSETRKQIEEGQFDGWEDIRLPFFPALRRRGFQAGAFLRLAEEMGITKTDKTQSKEEYFTNIEAFNREIIDGISDRAFFLDDPVTITVHGAPKISVDRDLHPSNKKGGRKFILGTSVQVNENEVEKDSTVLYRLMDAYNFRWEKDKYVFVSKSLGDYKNAKKRKIIHYLPAEQKIVAVKVHMPNGEWITGIAEEHVNKYSEGDLMQFERFGFVRLDNKKELEFWFAHN